MCTDTREAKIKEDKHGRVGQYMMLEIN